MSAPVPPVFPAVTGAGPPTMAVSVLQNFHANVVPAETFCLRVSWQVNVDLVSPNFSARIANHVLTRVRTGPLHADARSHRQNSRVRRHDSAMRLRSGRR